MGFEWSSDLSLRSGWRLPRGSQRHSEAWTGAWGGGPEIDASDARAIRVSMPFAFEALAAILDQDGYPEPTLVSPAGWRSIGPRHRSAVDDGSRRRLRRDDGRPPPDGDGVGQDASARRLLAVQHAHRGGLLGIGSGHRGTASTQSDRLGVHRRRSRERLGRDRRPVRAARAGPDGVLALHLGVDPAADCDRGDVAYVPDRPSAHATV